MKENSEHRLLNEELKKIRSEIDLNNALKFKAKSEAEEIIQRSQKKEINLFCEASFASQYYSFAFSESIKLPQSTFISKH